VQLLCAEYRHFIETPALLQEKLDCLVGVHGRSRIAAWKEMAAAGQWETLVIELLDQHYDPAYRKSTQRNFANIASALVIRAEDATAAQLNGLADELLARLGER
jgi:tRNA 2-selenouridine synthase